MSSRRRNSRKNLGNSISDIQRRIRRMERKPIRTRLQNRVIKGSAIAPSTITAEEVSFGTAVVTSDNPADVIDTPKEGLLVVNPTTNSASVYSEAQGDYVDVTDPTAQAAALASLQPSANTIVNASNQITAVNTNGITVYSGSSPTTGARIVMNSAGLAGFNSSSTGAGNGATFSISASTGDAIFSGTVNATGGTFTGYVTAGTARFGANVDSTDDGIWINANNYWYDTGAFKVGDGTESMTYTSAGGLVVTGDINATGGTFTGYVTGGTARFGANVDSTNDGIWINSYNYWYDTGAFKVGDGSESMSYSSAGGLVVTGEISAGTFSGSISSTATITGGSFVTTGNVGAFTGNALTITGGAISAGKVVSLSTTTALSDGVINLDTDYITLSAGIETEILGAIKMSGSTTFYGFDNTINVDTAVGGTSARNIRNVYIRTTLISTSSSDGNIGDIWLQYA